MKEKYKSSFSDYLDVIIKWRKFIIRNVIIVTVIAIIISFLLTTKYTATATILPPNPNQDVMFGFMPTSPYSGGAGLSSLAKLSGIVPGVSTPSELFVAIMKSASVKNEIIKRFNLQNIFRTKTMYDTHGMLEEMTKLDVSIEGIISIDVTYKDKFLAADIANAYVEELDKFNTEITMTVGKKYRIFIEKRLDDTEDSLAKAEETLRNFQETHRTVALDTEIEKAIEAIAELKSKIILLEVKKGALIASSQYANPYLQDLNIELRELKRQLAKIEFGTTEQKEDEFGAGFSVPLSELPTLALEYARLFREVKVQEAIYELSIQQYEHAKIMEVKDTPTVQFLDRAAPPEKKSHPKRRLIVMFAFFLSIFCSIPIAFLLTYFEDVKLKPQQHKMLIEFKTTISQDFSKFKRYVRTRFKMHI